MPITPHDIQALIDLLKRTPMSPAETLYANDLIARLAQLAAPPTEAPADPPPPTTETHP